jgi:hypothetical protein
LGLLAVTMFAQAALHGVVLCVFVALASLFLGLLDLGEVFLAVGARTAVAVGGAQFPARKALAVHF